MSSQNSCTYACCNLYMFGLFNQSVVVVYLSKSLLMYLLIVRSCCVLEIKPFRFTRLLWVDINSFLQVCVSADSIYLYMIYLVVNVFPLYPLYFHLWTSFPLYLKSGWSRSFAAVYMDLLWSFCTFSGGCAICSNPSVKSSLFWSQGQLYGMILKEPGLEGFAGSWTGET